MLDETCYKPGEVLFDRYRVVTLLGHGGMGSVYKVTELQEPGASPLALKILNSQQAAVLEKRSRFINEYHTLLRLSQAPVAKALALHDEVDGDIAFSLEFLPGSTLEELIESTAQKKLALADSIFILKAIAHAFIAIHEAGIICRDIKPSNIIISPRFSEIKNCASPILANALKIIDFGIACDSGCVPGSSARAAGTALYTPPESGAVLAASPVHDIYAFGVLAYLLLTGEPPFKSQEIGALNDERITNDVPSPRLLDSRISVALALIVNTCAAAEHTRRFTSFNQVLACLNAMTPRPDVGPFGGAVSGFAVRLGLLQGREPFIKSIA